jgi:4a-hydroxytetrahydrobiopterin dehydratase
VSDAGWKAFLAADGLDDWAVVHGGATAVFDAGTIDAAATFAATVARIDGFGDSGAVITLTGRRVGVRLTRAQREIEQTHVSLARRVSASAREHGAVPVRDAIQEVQFAVATTPDDADPGFWAAVLGYTAEPDGSLADPLGHGSTVWLQELDPAKPLRHAMHVDVSVPLDQVRARVAAAVAAGGRIVVDEGPEWWVLADRAGNKVCVVAWPDGAITQRPAPE